MNKLKQYQMFINGEWVDSENKKTFETLNPENNEPWAIVPEASAKDVDNAVNAAQKAFEGEWPKLLPRERALKKIWGSDTYFNGRSMDVYIAKLRKYLKEDSQIEIVNIHGNGFRLVAP